MIKTGGVLTGTDEDRRPPHRDRLGQEASSPGQTRTGGVLTGTDEDMRRPHRARKVCFKGAATALKINHICGDSERNVVFQSISETAGAVNHISVPVIIGCSSPPPPTPPAGDRMSDGEGACAG